MCEEEGNQAVPLTQVPLYLFFHHMFIVPDSSFEINVTSGMRRQINSKLDRIRDSLVTIDIFDECIDHMIELVYQNSFLKFVKKCNEI